MTPGFEGAWVNAEGNILSIRSAGRESFRARFRRRDGRVSILRRLMARLGMPAGGLRGILRAGKLEIEIGQGRALRLTFSPDAEGDRLVPEILPCLGEEWVDPRRVVTWLEPLSDFRRVDLAGPGG